jgi:low temperature requirement protein LtrA
MHAAAILAYGGRSIAPTSEFPGRSIYGNPTFGDLSRHRKELHTNARNTTATPPVAPHRIKRMTGRDPDEPHRSATRLELLFDLTFVVSFAAAADASAHLLAEGHIATAVAGFVFTAPTICWAWINYSWFASGFDTDDWVFRAMTMVQMVGVLIFALGIRPFFESIDRGEPINMGVVVAGYVVMRIAMVGQWLRAAKQAPAHRRSALIYVITILIAQAGWVLLATAGLEHLLTFFAISALLYTIEMGGPVLAKHREGGTPWHPHHIAERYGLLLIITLGEGIVGTITAVAALVAKVGWSTEAVLVVIAGTGTAFAVWWDYFIVPFGEFLNRHRRRTWGFGYGHILILSSVAAIGAGFHVAAYLVEGEATIGVPGAVAATAVPVLVFTLSYFGVYSLLVRAFDTFHLLLAAATVAILCLSVLLAMAGVSLGWCLIVVMMAPFVTVIGYETVGFQHVANDVLGRRNPKHRIRLW